MRDLVELPAAAFDDALVTDVYKPRMHQVLPALGSGVLTAPLLLPQPLLLLLQCLWLHVALVMLLHTGKVP